MVVVTQIPLLISETSTESTTIEQTENTESTPNNKVLTVYFSWASNVENNNVDGISSASIVNGNYHLVADYVQKATNSDVFEIKDTGKLSCRL